MAKTGRPYRKKIERDPETEELLNSKPSSDIIKELYDRYQVTVKAMSLLTWISEDTIMHWTARTNNPPAYIARYIKMCLESAITDVSPNIDTIHNMTDKEIADFLEDVQRSAIAAGSMEKMPDKYKDFDAFLTGFQLCKPTLHSALSRSLALERAITKSQNELAEISKLNLNTPADRREYLYNMYIQSRLTKSELSDITYISSSTLEAYLFANKRSPKLFTIRYVQMCLDDYNKKTKVQNNADYIRNINKSELVWLLNDIRDSAILYSQGKKELPKEYTDFEKFMNGIDLLTFGYIDN